MSAIVITDDGNIFYRVDVDRVIVGLENLQANADFISETTTARLAPVPVVQLIPIENEGHSLLEDKVKTRTLTPYFYYQNGHVLLHESTKYNSQQLLSLRSKNTHMT